ncbi:MAG: CHAP domain-containing protein [Alphaproteobacteria bacterium]
MASRIRGWLKMKRGVFVAMVMAVAVSACSGWERNAAYPVPPAQNVVLVPPSPLKPYPDTSGFLQCVPFARAVSGLELRGDAHTWWEQAADRYERGRTPRLGAVLAFKQTSRLTLGHVAVVAQVSNPREILVTHANWGSDGDTRGVVHERQPVMDVSPDNDWSQVRLMNIKGKFGSVYTTHGFIYQPPADLSRVTVNIEAAGVPPADRDTPKSRRSPDGSRRR